MKQKTKEVYYCEHCNKHGLVKNAMIKHENQCIKNPELKHPCYSCQHFEIEEGTNEQHYEGGGETHTRDVAYKVWSCKAKKIYLHNKRSEIRGLIDRYPESFIDTELMPKVCEQYKSTDLYPVQEADTFL